MKVLTEKSQDSFVDPLVILASIYPSLTKVPLFKQAFDRFELKGRLQLTLHSRIVSLHSEINKYLSGIIEEHQKNQDRIEDSEPRDFIDSYLLE